MERLVFVRQLRPVSVEIARTFDARQWPIDAGAVRQIANGGSGRMKPLEVVFECDRSAISRVGMAIQRLGFAFTNVSTCSNV